MKKVMKIGISVIVWILILLMAIFIVMTISKDKTADDAPSFGGYSLLAVLSDSMKGDKDNSFNEGDMIIVSKFKVEEAKDLEVGDIITFRDLIDVEGTGTLANKLNSHRIIDIEIDENNNYLFTTQGDNNDDPDDTKKTVGDIFGVYKMQLPKFGSIINFFLSSNGILICMVLPMLMVTIWCCFRLVKAVKAYRNATDEPLTEGAPAAESDTKANDLRAELEATKAAAERARLELEQLRAMQNGEIKTENNQVDSTENDKKTSADNDIVEEAVSTDAVAEEAITEEAAVEETASNADTAEVVTTEADTTVSTEAVTTEADTTKAVVEEAAGEAEATEEDK